MGFITPLSTKLPMLSDAVLIVPFLVVMLCCYAEHCYTECLCAKCSYANCHYAECRGGPSLAFFPGANIIKHLRSQCLFHTKVFVPGKPFQPCRRFVRKVRAYPRETPFSCPTLGRPLVVLPRNIRLSLKILPGTNTPAHYKDW